MFQVQLRSYNLLSLELINTHFEIRATSAITSSKE
jgi:hypothetical protein